MTLAGYYNRQGHFDKTIEALEERAAKEPNNPEAFYTIATYYWDEAYRDFKLKDSEKKDYRRQGARRRSTTPCSSSPTTSKRWSTRACCSASQANLEKDPAKQQALLKEADQLRDKAQELRKQKAAGIGN